MADRIQDAAACVQKRRKRRDPPDDGEKPANGGMSSAKVRAAWQQANADLHAVLHGVPLSDLVTELDESDNPNPSTDWVI